MPISLMCPNLLCRKILMVPDELRGKRVRCSYCGNVLLVPKKSAKSMAAREETDNLVATDSTGDEKGKKG